MQVDLIDLMAQADVVLKPEFDEKQPVLSDQYHIFKKWNDMSKLRCYRSLLNFDSMIDITDYLAHLEPFFCVFLLR